jgi:hypothetical protein
MAHPLFTIGHSPRTIDEFLALLGRRNIADHLLVAGEAVFHILGPVRVEPARLTPAVADGLVYACE